MDIPTFHRMKYTDSIVFKMTVIFDSINSPSNISFFYAMFKRRLTKFDVYIHVFSITQNSRKLKVCIS
jgi:hypothetical protein